MDLINPLLRRAQNLGSEVKGPESQSNQAEVDHSTRYLVIFSLLAGATGVFFSYALSAFHRAPSGSTILMVTGSIVALLVILIFQCAMVQHVRFAVPLLLVQGLTFFSFLMSSFSGWYIAAYLLYSLAVLLGYHMAYKILNEAVTVDFMHYANVMMRGGITALALFLASLYVGLYHQAGGISFTAYKFVLSGTMPGLEYIGPNFTPDTKVNTLIGEAVTNYFKKERGGVFTTLSETAQKQLIAQATPGVLDQIKNFTSQAVKPTDTLVGYTFDWLTNFLKSLEARGLGWLVIVVLFLLIFFGIKSVMFIVRWPIAFFIFMLYGLLKSIGIFKVTIEPRPREVLIVQ